MPRRENQKLKLLYLADMLREETDENHVLSMPAIISRLEARGVSAERKSIYSDMDALEAYGMDILRSKAGYALAHRTFELPELKLLVDAVQSCRFLSASKSRALIKKLESLCSRYEAQDLQRQVYVAGRVKSMNESVYYNIDALHDAINHDKQIRFQYFRWTPEKKQQLRRGGRRYRVSPYALIWQDENYYLVGFDEEAQDIRHYRVDKMTGITTGRTKRSGKELFEHFDVADYVQKTFGMFGGEPVRAELVFANSLAGVVLDRFGDDVTFLRVDKDHFKVCVDVVPSPQFMGWLAGFGTQARIAAPRSLADDFKKMCLDILSEYK